MNREEQLKADIAAQRPDWAEGKHLHEHLERDTDAQLEAVKAKMEEDVRKAEPSFGATLEGIKRGLGIDGKGLDALAQKLLDIIMENPTHAVVALAKHGWVLTTQQELDEERAAVREKIAAARNKGAGKDATSLLTSIRTILHVAHDELGSSEPSAVDAAGYVNSVLKLLTRLEAALQ